MLKPAPIYVSWRDPENYILEDKTDEIKAKLRDDNVQCFSDKQVIDVRIDWSAQHDNSPTLSLITAHQWVPGDWPNKVFEYNKEKGVYVSESGDGRAEFHYHGPLYEDPKLGWVTKEDRGYAGREFPITMKDGRKAILRGPWHSIALPPYQEISYFPIYDTIGFFGIAWDYNRALQTMFHYLPNIRMVLVTPKDPKNKIISRTPQVEIMHSDYMIPKICWSKEHKDMTHLRTMSYQQEQRAQALAYRKLFPEEFKR